jgi:phosphoribosylaminoimidazole-succinocarboxamide synthase
MVASDRISIYDVVMPTPIPDKGKVLNRMSLFWFELTGDIVPNHLISDDVPEEVAERAMRVRRLEMYPVECVVRGYLSGSGWKEYKATEKICGIKIPKGLKESDQLEEPLFTPSTKAEHGHDINISFKDVEKEIGADLARKIRKASLELYQKAALYAVSKGVIIADTKFEFGLDGDELVLVDEIFTPDSSRFWPLSLYEPGKPQPSLDKQFVRDYLETTAWDKNTPPPELPGEIVAKTSQKYLEIYKVLTGLDDLA